MLRRRVLYLTCLVGCIGFYIAYREWMAWLFLVTLAVLPWFSLLISLPSILFLKVRTFPTRKLQLGQELALALQVTSFLPAPPITWRFTYHSGFDEKTYVIKNTNTFQPKHCGKYTIGVKKGRKYDFLSLFRFPFGKKLQQTVYVLPTPVRVENLPDLEKSLWVGWKPKPDGFSEVHDLREYRPGDNLRQIHWKLSAKTGKYIYREPLRPLRKRPLLTICLCGSEDVLDRKLGRLLYVSSELLKLELTHELRCMARDRVYSFRILDQKSLEEAVVSILSLCPCAAEHAMSEKSAWQYHIGGDPNEA